MSNPFGLPNFPFPYAPPGPDYAPPQQVAPPPGSQFREGQNEWQLTDAIRWGDEDNIVFNLPTFIGPPPTLTQLSKQLVRANVPRGVVWLLQVNASATMPTGEVAPVNVDFEVSIGTGQSRTTFFATSIVLTAANGYKLPFASVPPQLFVPAADLQVRARASYTPTTSPGTATVAVGCMAAPFTRWD
jgi:hypothetical protein